MNNKKKSTATPSEGKSQTPEGKGGRLHSSLINAVGGVFIVKILGQGLLFGTMIFLARLIGDGPYGKFIYFMAWARIFGVGLKAGFDTALLRYLPAYVADENWGLAKGILRHTFSTVFGYWGLAILIIIGIGFTGYGKWLEDHSTLIFWAAILVLVMSLSELMITVLQGWRSPVHAFFPNLVLRPIFLGLTILLAVRSFGFNVSGELALACNAVAFLACLFLLILWSYQKAPSEVKSTPAITRKKEWNSTAVSMLFISGVHLVLAQTDTIMIGLIQSPTESGYYGSAGRLAGLVIFGLIAANGVVAPAISAHHARGETRQIQSMLDAVSKWILIFGFPVSLFLILAGRFLLGLWGDSFVSAYPALVVLVIAQFVNVWAGPVGFLMTMTGRQKIAAWVLGVSALLNILLNFLLIPQWGMVGAGIATGITMILWNLSLVIYANKSLGLRTTILWPRRGEI